MSEKIGPPAPEAPGNEKISTQEQLFAEADQIIAEVQGQLELDLAIVEEQLKAIKERLSKEYDSDLTNFEFWRLYHFAEEQDDEEAIKDLILINPFYEEENRELQRHERLTDLVEEAIIDDCDFNLEEFFQHCDVRNDVIMDLLWGKIYEYRDVSKETGDQEFQSKAVKMIDFLYQQLPREDFRYWIKPGARERTGEINRLRALRRML